MSKKSKNRRDVEVDVEYWEEVELTDPDTGDKIKQKVKITRYKPTKKKRDRKDVNVEMSEDIQDIIESERENLD